MSWDDGFLHKDSRDSPGKAGNRQEMQQEHPETLGKTHGPYWHRWENAQEHPEQRTQPMECIGVIMTDVKHPIQQARTQGRSGHAGEEAGTPKTSYSAQKCLAHGVAGSIALRVTPAVTRLTVYRRPQVMRPGEKQVPLGPKLFMATTGFKHEMLRIYLSDHDAELE